jgi:O-antigen/teichoic acid export membrane protein
MARSMSISFVGNLFPPLAALASGPILAQALGVEGRGAVAAATAPLGLAITLMTFGVPESVTYLVARRPGLVRVAARHASWIIVLAGIVAMAAVLGARSWLSAGDVEIQQLMVISSLSVIPNLLLGVVRGIASGMQQWKLVAWERALSSGLRLVAMVPLWLTGHLTPVTATILFAAMPVTGALAYLRLSRRLAPATRDVDGEASTRSLTGYGMRLWIGSISGVLLHRVDQTLMTPLNSAYQLGLYVVAVNVSELPLIIHRAVRDVTFVTDAHESDDARLATAARISTAVCAVAAAGLGLTMVWWLPFLFGPSFGGSVPVAAVLLIAVVLGTPGSIAGTGLSARGRPGLRSISLAVACLVNVALLVAFVPRWGAMGAAWATFAGYLMSSAANLYFLRRLFGIQPWMFFGLRRSDVVVVRRFASGLRRLLPGGSRRRRASRAGGAPQR